MILSVAIDGGGNAAQSDGRKIADAIKGGVPSETYHAAMTEMMGDWQKVTGLFARQQSLLNQTGGETFTQRKAG